MRTTFAGRAVRLRLVLAGPVPRTLRTLAGRAATRQFQAPDPCAPGCRAGGGAATSPAHATSGAGRKGGSGGLDLARGRSPRRLGDAGPRLRSRPPARTALALVLPLLIAVFVTTIASAQSVADLVAKNLAARGGAERLKAVDALKITGRMKSMGLDLPLTIWRRRPNLVRQEMRLQDRAIVQAFDGERAWTVNPLAGSDEPQEIRGQPADMMREQSDFDGPLVDYQQKGSAIEVEGPDTVEGVKAIVLKITLKSGRVQRVWLDADTGLEVKSASEVPQGPRTVRVETILSDYRPEDGLVMPHRLRTFVDGQLQADVTIDRIEVSPRIDPAIFRMPGRGAGG